MLKLLINNIFFIKFDFNYLILCYSFEVMKNKFIMNSWLSLNSIYISLINYKSIFFSRKKNRYWFKGNESNNIQCIKKIYIDCDMDVIYFYIIQINNICCHYNNINCYINIL